MIVGVPTEIKNQEYRVAMTPQGVPSLTREGHETLVQRGAGTGSGFSDEKYASSRAQLVDSPEAVYAGADMIVKVKEPLEAEYPFLRPDLVLFTYLHLAAEPQLAKAMF